MGDLGEEDSDLEEGLSPKGSALSLFWGTTPDP